MYEERQGGTESSAALENRHKLWQDRQFYLYLDGCLAFVKRHAMINSRKSGAVVGRRKEEGVTGLAVF